MRQRVHVAGMAGALGMSVAELHNQVAAGNLPGVFYLGAANPPGALQEDCSVHMQYTICPQSEETPVRA